MIDYIKGVFCVEASWLYGEGEVMSYCQYKHLVSGKQITLTQKGGNGRKAMVDYDSLPQRFINIIMEKHGDLKQQKVAKYMEFVFQRDEKARDFYSRWITPDNGHLKSEVVQRYSINAEVLNAIDAVYTSKVARKRGAGRPTAGIWQEISENINNISEECKWNKNTLPKNSRRLADVYRTYKEQGYKALIHKGFGHNNSRKVGEKLEGLILSIYCKGNKPYARWVWEDYMMFLAGGIDIVDVKTGELFDREEFRDDRTGNYTFISESTCWNYINNPLNRAIVDSIRMGNHKYNSMVRPHAHRQNAQFGLSKISLDDRELPRKMADGSRVMAYYAYDVASGCLIGASYSRTKDVDLFVDCLRDMFWFIDRHGWGLPMELEVEHHLVSNFKEDLMKSEVVFPFVTFCAPGNSQQKHAEQLNRQKKYGYEKRYQDGIGRWYLSDDSNVPKETDRIWSDEANKYIVRDKHTFTFEELVADDRHTIELYNNATHRLDKTKTKLQLLHENINPSSLVKYNRPLLIKYIGNCTKTSIKRNHYVQVQGKQFGLPDPMLLSKLKPNNYEVQAYWLPYGELNEVVLYQDEKYISTCQRIEKFTTAKAEWTDHDTVALASQMGYIKGFDSVVKKGSSKLSRVKIYQNLNSYEEVETNVIEQEEVFEDTELAYEELMTVDWGAKAHQGL